MSWKLYLFTLLYFWLAHIMIKHFFSNFAKKQKRKDSTYILQEGYTEKLLKDCNKFYLENCLFLTKGSFFFLYTLRILLAIPNAFGVYLVTLFFLLPYFMWNLHGIPWHPKIRTFITLHKEMYPNSCFCTIIQFSFLALLGQYVLLCLS